MTVTVAFPVITVLQVSPDKYSIFIKEYVVVDDNVGVVTNANPALSKFIVELPLTPVTVYVIFVFGVPLNVKLVVFPEHIEVDPEMEADKGGKTVSVIWSLAVPQLPSALTEEVRTTVPPFVARLLSIK